jgi:hypothetical protein
MNFDKLAAKALLRVFRDKPFIRLALEKVSIGEALDEKTALATAVAVMAHGDFDVPSMCVAMGVPHLEPQMIAAQEQERVRQAFILEEKQKALADAATARQQRAERKLLKEREDAEKQVAKQKAAEAKAEAQRLMNERMGAKQVFCTKGRTGTHDISTMAPAIGKWLAKQSDVFIAGGVLSRWRDSKGAMQVINTANFGSLLGLGFSFCVQKFSPTGEEILEFMSQCPADLRTTVLETSYFPDVREVEAVLNRPVVTVDGEVVGTTPGYDADSKFLFHETEPLVTVSVEDAYRAIKDVFVDFPEGIIPGALALIFTDLCRPSLTTAPMVFVNAPAPGSGKSLLAECCLSIVNSAPLTPLGETKGDNQEFDKQLKSYLSQYPGRAVFFDDFSGTVNQQMLKMILTSPNAVEFRILGTPKQYKARTNFMIVMTGNNLVVDFEISRRSIEILVDTGVENPSADATIQRRRTPDQLRAHIKNNQTFLLSCAVTMLVDAIKNATNQHKTRPMGSFETWADVVGKSVVYCTQKYKEFGLLPEEIEGDVTPKLDGVASNGFDNIAEVLHAVYDRYRDRAWTIRELDGECKVLMEDMLGSAAEKSTAVKTQILFRKSKRPYAFGSASYQLNKVGMKWQVKVVKGSHDPIDPEADATNLPAHMDKSNLQVN